MQMVWQTWNPKRMKIIKVPALTQDIRVTLYAYNVNNSSAIRQRNVCNYMSIHAISDSFS